MSLHYNGAPPGFPFTIVTCRRPFERQPQTTNDPNAVTCAACLEMLRIRRRQMRMGAKGK